MTQPEYAEEPCTIDLSGDEALVLFELLSRWFEDVHAASPGAEYFESPAETRALNRLHGQLEVRVAAPFRKDYEELLRSARERLASDWDWTNLRG